MADKHPLQTLADSWRLDSTVVQATLVGRGMRKAADELDAKLADMCSVALTECVHISDDDCDAHAKPYDGGWGVSDYFERGTFAVNEEATDGDAE